MVLDRRKAVAIQENLVFKSRTSEMVGSAVFVMLPSSAERSSGMHMAMKDRQKPSDRVHFAEQFELDRGEDIVELLSCSAASDLAFGVEVKEASLLGCFSCTTSSPFSALKLVEENIVLVLLKRCVQLKLGAGIKST